jgi:hypothetical protein
VTNLVNQFGSQVAACRKLGAPFTAELLERAAADLTAGGVTYDALRDHLDAPQPTATPLRLAGALHRLVLAGRAPELAAHYPRGDDPGDATAAWAAAVRAITDNLAYVREILTRPPQTNEVGRAAVLLGVGARLMAQAPLPVRLAELGASAGLNLRADQFAVTAATAPGGPVLYGPPHARVILAGAWAGELPPHAPPLDVTERRGCDLDPIDPTTPEGAQALQSYVWPEQTERLARLRGALDVARDVPAVVERMGAADFVATLAPRTGTWLDVWHSVMWQYVPAEEQRLVAERLAALAHRATADAPVAHAAFEPVDPASGPFRVTLRTWPEGGVVRVLGTAAPHGIPVTWHS